MVPLLHRNPSNPSNFILGKEIKMTEDQDIDIIYDQIRGILGEHFHNFCFIVMDDGGDLFYDYTNYRVGKMLMNEALEDANSELDAGGWNWPEDDEDDYEDEDLI